MFYHMCAKKTRCHMYSEIMCTNYFIVVSELTVCLGLMQNVSHRTFSEAIDFVK